MNCQPCNAGDHGNCTTDWDGPILLGLGLSWRCLCWENNEIHFVPAKVAAPARRDWSDEEFRDHEHDTGQGPDDWKYDDAEEQRLREEEMSWVTPMME